MRTTEPTRGGSSGQISASHGRVKPSPGQRAPARAEEEGVALARGERLAANVSDLQVQRVLTFDRSKSNGDSGQPSPMQADSSTALLSKSREHANMIKSLSSPTPLQVAGDSRTGVAWGIGTTAGGGGDRDKGMQERAEAMLRISVALVEICEQVAGELHAMRAEVLRAHAVDTIAKVDARLGQATQGPRSAVDGLHEARKHTFHHHVPPDVHAPAQKISASMQMPAITSTPGHTALHSTGSAEKHGIWVQWFPRESPQVEEMAAGVGSPRSMANASDASLQSVSERLAPCVCVCVCVCV